MTTTHWLVIASGFFAILYAIYAGRAVLAADTGTERMREISAAVQEGATAYLNRQYSTIAIVGGVIFVLTGLLLDWLSAIGFLIGAILSGATGYIGLELIKLLIKHPKVKIKNLCAKKSIGKSMYKYDSSLKKKSLPKISNFSSINFNEIDLLFTALPNGEAQKISNLLLNVYVSISACLKSPILIFLALLTIFLEPSIPNA